MRYLKYILLILVLIVNTNMKGQYNPTNPSEPGSYKTLTLKSTPNGSGYFSINAVTTQTPGVSVRVCAYSNSNYTFIAWEEDGNVISTNAQFDYTMPLKNAILTAHYEYNPSNPSEPTPPVIPIYRKLTLSTNPSSGGSFNINSGNSYELGTSVYVCAYTNSNFTFLNWTENGEIISTSSSFNYVIKDTDSHIVANYSYSPNNPSEPTEAKLLHTLNLQSVPSAGGYFNISNSNKYEEGSTVSLRAYNNQYYTFVSWTIGDSVIGNNYQLSYVMPTHDVTLRANYIYNYAPEGPSEPDQPAAHIAIYGMTEDAIRGQNFSYPVFLENTQKEVMGVVVDVQFPNGFTISKDDIKISDRTSGHILDILDLGDNNYRLSVKGSELITGDNGKLIEIPVSVPDTAVMGKSYPVVLTHGVIYMVDNSQSSINVRSGGILIEKVSEDGLYSRFSFDKYQNRVKFANNSSDKSVRYEWNFGDGQTSTETAPMHIYSQAGSYVVTLTAYGEIDKDVAEMNVIINESSTWTAQGTYNLTSQEIGIRNFSSISDLFSLFDKSTINGNIRISVESGNTYSYDLTSENVQTLKNLTAKLGGHRMTFEKSGDSRNPIIMMGQDLSSFNSETRSALFSFGRLQQYQDVELKLWNLFFDVNHLQDEHTQTVCSGIKTEACDFSLLSRDLKFQWTLQNPLSTITGFEESGERILPAMTINNEQNGIYDFEYHVAGMYEGKEIYGFDYHIIVNPALVGLFGNLSPSKEANMESTDVTLTWSKIANATFDVYLWNDKNPVPTNPVAENISELRYTSTKFCANGNSYRWLVKAHNECQELVSDTMSFSIESLPDLHVYSLDCSEAVGDGKVTVKWIVKNDGAGSTGATRWNDYIWLIPDVYGGTGSTGSKLIKTVENVKALAVGESYDASVEIDLPEHVYGNYFLLVASDMYNVSEIQWSTIGGSIITPYNPSQDGSTSYKHLYASTSAQYNKVYEQGENESYSDNFFYKKIEIAVPNLADLKVTNVVATVIPGKDPIVSAAKTAAKSDVVTLTNTSEKIEVGYSDADLETLSLSASPSPVSAAGLRYSNGFYTGKLIAVKVTVDNIGGMETYKPFRTVLYMSKSTDRDASPLTAIASETCNPSVTAGKKAVITYAFNMPYDWNGDIYFHAYADVDDNIYELASTVNNWGTSAKYDCVQLPGADFKPSSLKTPKTLSVNTPFNVSYEVKNNGAGIPLNSNWNDRIYISKKSTGLDESATEIASINRSGSFSLTSNTTGGVQLLVKPEDFHYYGDNYSVSKDMTLSNLTTGRYYLYVKCNDENKAIETGGWDDNVICSDEINCIAPDIEVVLESLSSETIKSQETLALTWKVKNTGSGDIQNATLKDAFYASVNQDGANSIQVADLSNIITIAAGQEKTLRANVVIPNNSNLNGIRYVFLKTNVDNGVKEASSSNNQTAIKKMTFEYVAEAEKPTVKGTNISLSELSIPSSVTLGSEFTAALIVKNNGEYTVDKDVAFNVYVSSAPQLDIDKATLCASSVVQGTVNGLKTNAAVNISLKVTFPSQIKGGKLFLHIAADKDNILNEKNTSDNRTYGYVTVVGNQADLTLKNVICPEVVKTSTPTEVSLDCSNIGSWTAGVISVAIYLSQDATYNYQDELLATISVPSLDVNASSSLKTNISLEDKKSGKWYLILRADCNNNVSESNESNNDVTMPLQVYLSPIPDLVPTEMSTSDLLMAGQSIKIAYTVTNKGAHATRQDKWSDTYYLSTSATLNSTTDIKLGSKTHVGLLEVGKSYSSEVQFTIPQNTVGNYMLYVVTDAADAVYEENENNNGKCIPVYVNSQNDRPADLVISNVSALGRIKAGQTVTIEYTISNEGEFTATGELNDAIYLSKDNQWDANDIMVGVVKGNVTINPGSSITRSATGRIINVTEGNYYVIVRTNSTRTISEQSADNNTVIQKSPSSVTFDELSLDGSTSLITSGLYKMSTATANLGKTIGFYLDHNKDVQSGLYVSYEKVPSTAIYDYASCVLETNQQEVLVSKVQQGNYYILAQDNRAVVNAENNRFYLDGVPSEQSTALNLSAKVVNFGATSFKLKEGGTGGWISTDVKGALFDSIMDFRLQMDKRVIPAESVTFNGQTVTKVTFNLNDATTGNYDVLSELPDGTLATLPSGFRVIPGASVGLGIKMDVPSTVRVGSYAPISIAYANDGTTDISIYEMLLVIDEGYLGESIPDLENHQSVIHIKPDLGADNRGYISIPPGTHNVLNLFMYQIARTSTITIYIVK